MNRLVNLLVFLAALAFIVGTVARFLGGGNLLGNEAVVYRRGGRSASCLSPSWSPTGIPVLAAVWTFHRRGFRRVTDLREDSTGNDVEAGIPAEGLME